MSVMNKGEWVEESRKHYLLEYDKLFVTEFHYDKTEKQQGFVLSKLRQKLLSGAYSPADLTIRAYRMWYRENKVRLFQTSLKEHFEIPHNSRVDYKKGCFGEFINFKNKIEINNFIQLKSQMNTLGLSFEENIEYSVVIHKRFVPDEIVEVEETPEVPETYGTLYDDKEFNLNEDCCKCNDNFIRKELIIHKNKFYCGDCNDKRKKEKKENNERIRKKKEDKLLKKSVIDEIPIEPEKKKVIKKKKKVIKKDNPIEPDDCPEDNKATIEKLKFRLGEMYEKDILTPKDLQEIMDKDITSDKINKLKIKYL